VQPKRTTLFNYGRRLAELVLVLLWLSPSLLVRSERPQPADAIVIIGGDHKPARIAKAVQLYQAGYAPDVLLSAGNWVLEGNAKMPEDWVLKRLAVANGIPDSAILLEADSLSTVQNAGFTAKIAQAHGWEHILLVTSHFQSRRAAWLFRQHYPSNISIQVIPADGCTLCWLVQPDQAEVVGYEWFHSTRQSLGLWNANESLP
jgi:uncharacterized SAM-binding protein YcdF (DUF218 family)